MRIEPKVFDIPNNERPKVLLLGNGINRAFNYNSWDGLLDVIKDDARFTKNSTEYNMPMPIKTTMLTKGNVYTAINKNLKHIKNRPEVPLEEKELLQSLCNLGFDFILTTNYTREIEDSLIEKSQPMHNYSGRKGIERIYYLHTFNTVKRNDKKYDIWHIHGDIEYPKSIIASHSYYGNLLSKYNTELNKSTYYKKNRNKPLKVTSWVDAVMFGNVYIVGFGFDFSEFDLWWLLTRKYEKGLSESKTFFYEPKINGVENCDYLKRFAQCTLLSSKQSEKTSKIELMDVLNVETINLNCTADNNDEYIKFYKAVIEDIKSKLEDTP